MKSVKISDVHYSMLLELGKKWRMKIEDLLEEVIQKTTTTKRGDDMKGMYARFQQRQAKKIFPAAMEVYAETPNHLTQASGRWWTTSRVKAISEYPPQTECEYMRFVL